MKKNFQTLKLRFAILLMLISSYSLLPAQWVKKANAVKARSELGSVVYNGKLYDFMGFRDYNLDVESSSEVYDPASNTWKLLGSLASNKAVTHAGVALIDDNVWIVGGRVGKNPGPLTSEIWIYNITKNSWSAGPLIMDPATGKPILWAAGGAVFLGRTLHIFGGFVINACNNDQDKYHLTLNVDDWMANKTKPASWKNILAPMPVKRNHFGTIVLGGKIYAIGGQFGHDCGGGQDKQYSHVYDPATDTWTQLTTLPAARSHIEGGSFAMDGKIYLVCGQGTDGKDTKLVTIFDPAGNGGKGSWTDDNTLTIPAVYEGICAKVINSTFIIAHGGAGDSRYPKNLTYSRTLSRNPVYKLGFPSTCVTLNDASPGSLKGNTWLFTIDGTKAYSTSSNASWLSVTKNATGTAIPNAVDIEVTANTSGLAPGSYSGKITATGTAGGTTYTAATLCVNLTVQNTGTLTYTMVTTANGNGTISKNPDQPNYTNGTNVTLTAIPASGQQFIGWSGSASGTTNPLTVVMNANKTITANFQPTGSTGLITNLTTTSTKSYVIAPQLQTNINYYTDRTYIITSVPDYLVNAPFIKTPNDDKANKAASLIQFNLTQNATLYVGYDPRATSLPAWLADWQKDTSTLGITDNTLTYFNLYKKVFPAGSVTLGGNLQSPAAGSLNNYIVIGVPQTSQSARKVSTTGNAVTTKAIANNSTLSVANNAGLYSQDNIAKIKIYPNPFHGNSIAVEMVNLPGDQNVDITVSDLFGKVYQTFKEVTDEAGVLNKQEKFDEALSKGVYILKINASSFSRVIKIVVD